MRVCVRFTCACAHVYIYNIGQQGVVRSTRVCYEANEISRLIQFQIVGHISVAATPCMYRALFQKPDLLEEPPKRDLICLKNTIVTGLFSKRDLLI